MDSVFGAQLPFVTLKMCTMSINDPSFVVIKSLASVEVDSWPPSNPIDLCVPSILSSLGVRTKAFCRRMTRNRSNLLELTHIIF
jgi:hypothetical protein